MYGYGYYNPMPDQLTQLRTAQMPQQQPSNGLIWVQGESGAKSYLTAPNTTVLLMDSEKDVFYIKSSDASGMPLPLRVFEYKERTPNAVSSASVAQGEFITREEFEAFKAAIKGGSNEQSV